MPPVIIGAAIIAIIYLIVKNKDASNAATSTLIYQISSIGYDLPSTVKLVMTVTNPTTYNVLIPTMTGNLTINGTSLGTGSVPNVNCPAGQTVNFPIKVGISDLSVISVIVNAVTSGNYTGDVLKLTGTAYYQGPNGTMVNETFSTSYTI